LFRRGLYIGPTGGFGSATGGFLSVIFELLIGVFICLFNSASLGMPGIGGVFFGSGLPSFFVSVIPGIGVDRFDIFKLPDCGFEEMPGAEFVIMEGVPEKSGDTLAEALEFAERETFLFVDSLD